MHGDHDYSRERDERSENLPAIHSLADDKVRKNHRDDRCRGKNDPGIDGARVAQRCENRPLGEAKPNRPDNEGLQPPLMKKFDNLVMVAHDKRQQDKCR
jgi:hypothetical protein